MKRLAGVIGLMTLTGSMMLAQSAGQALSPQDTKWLTYAAHDNQGEIRICLLAEKHSQNPAVKAFARLMVADHVEVESQLATVADATGAQLPDDAGQEAQQTLSKLQPLRGSEFDREFMSKQIEDHSNDIKKYRGELQSTQNQAVQRYAALVLPILEQHLALAQAVQKQL